MALRPWLLGAVLATTSLVAADATATTVTATSTKHAQKKKPKPGKTPKKPHGDRPLPVPPAPPKPKVEATPRQVRALPITVTRLLLDNGLRVVLSPDPRVPVVSVIVAYDAGSRDEDRGATGTALVASRLLFQGSANVLRGEHERLVWGRGGEIVRANEVDRTIVGGIAPSSELPLLLWLEADRMKSLTVTQDALDTVKKAQLAARAQELAAPLAAGRERLRELVFQGSFALEHDPRGAIADLGALRLDPVKAFCETRLSAPNAVVAIAGDFDVDHATQLVHRFFDTAKRPERAESKPPAPVPEQTSQRTAVLEDAHTRAPSVLFGWAIPAAGTEDHDALSAAVAILSGGPASRLGQRLLLDKPLALAVRGRTEGLRGMDLLSIEVDVESDAARLDVLRAVEAELDALARSGPTDAELDAYRAGLEASAETAMGRADERALRLAEVELSLGDARLLATELPRRAGVTREKIRAAVTRYLVPARRTLVEVLPPRDASDPPKKPPPPPSAPPPPPPRHPPRHKR